MIDGSRIDADDVVDLARRWTGSRSGEATIGELGVLADLAKWRSSLPSPPEPGPGPAKLCPTPTDSD
jgi:hypothetical protein